MSERRWALVTFLVATAGFVAIAAWRIPWHPVPGGTPSAVPAESVFTPAQIARAHAYTDPARHLGSPRSGRDWSGGCGAGGGSACCWPY